jgi:hypothetical protein
MNVTEQDIEAGFKEIRIAMQDGTFEIVRVSAITREKMEEILTPNVTPATSAEFVSALIGRDTNFVSRIQHGSSHQIFLTGCALLGVGSLARQITQSVAERLVKQADEI